MVSELNRAIAANDTFKGVAPTVIQGSIKYARSMPKTTAWLPSIDRPSNRKWFDDPIDLWYHFRNSRIYYVYTNDFGGVIMGSGQEKGVIHMTTKVQKWGNSFAVRIPKHVAEQMNIDQGSEMDMIVENQEIKLIPKQKKLTLEELLAKVTPKNRHDEIDLGTGGDELL